MTDTDTQLADALEHLAEAAKKQYALEAAEQADVDAKTPEATPAEPQA